MSQNASSSSSHMTSPSLVSVATTSSASSSTPLRQSSSTHKDYSAAFGLLQSQYGWGGPVPVQPPTRRSEAPKPKEKKEQRKETRSTSAKETPRSARGGKNFEDAFGALSSRLGFGGGAPVPTPSLRSTRSKSRDERR
ncbi:hypothetical protein BD413DRAFT_593699 [Trametes elegans]|nr:hypothetical protein BD413DRAFT_593699 [Trametes elegans]